MTVSSQDFVLKLVAGMFGAAPGAGFLPALTEAVDAQGPGQLAVTLGNSSLFQSLYPAQLSHQAFAQSFLASLVPGFDLFNGAHADAASWVAAMLDGGEQVGQVVLDVLVALNGISPSDATWGAARQQWDQRTEAARVYSVDRGISAFNLPELQDALHAPRFTGGVVNAGTLTLTYSDLNLLDPFQGPAASQFAVTVAGAARGVTSVSVNAGAGTVTLTLDTAVANGQAVTVAYNDLSVGNDVVAIQDAGGNDAAGFSAVPVTNITVAPPPDVTAPVLASASVNGTALTLTYTELNLLDADHPPAAGAFTVMVAGVARTATAVSVDAAAKTVALTLASAVFAGEAVTVAYTDPTSGNDASAVQDASGNDAASFTATAATNTSAAAPDTTAPVFDSASVDGDSLILTYIEVNQLDAAHRPAAGAFSVMVDGVARAVNSVLIDPDGKTAELTLASAVANGQVVTVAYSDPTAGNDVNAIQDVSGNDAARLNATAVTNITRDTTAPVFASATVSAASLVMTYTELNLLDSAHPPLAGAFAVTVAGVARTVTDVTVHALSKTVVLTLESAVTDGQAVTVAYTDPTTGNNGSAIQDATGNDAASLPATAVVNLTDTTPPLFAGAEVVGASLVLTYSELNPLDAAHKPAAGDFAVTVAGSADAVTAVAVNAGAHTVTLTLTGAAAKGDLVTVAYTDPSAANDTNAIQDASGNDAATLGVSAVTNNTPDVTPPAFSGAAVTGDTLVLTYTELFLLDAVNTPATGAFAVVAGGVGDSVTGVAVNAAAHTVTLTLTSAVANGQVVTVAYSDPTPGNDVNAIQDDSGNDAASLGVTGVTNNTPDTTPPVFTGATVNGATLVLSYTELNLLDVANAPAAGDFAVVVAGSPDAVTGVSVDGAAHTVTLTLTSAVANGDAVTVAYTDPTAGDDANAIQDDSGNDAASLGVTGVTNNTPDTTPPVLAGATFNASTLILSYTELNLLDAANGPAAGDFAVVVGGSADAVTGVSVNGAAHTVTLTLASAALAADVVTVSYTDPSGANDANAIQDDSGNDAVSLVGVPVVFA